MPGLQKQFEHKLHWRLLPPLPIKNTPPRVELIQKVSTTLAPFPLGRRRKRRRRRRREGALFAMGNTRRSAN